MAVPPDRHEHRILFFTGSRAGLDAWIASSSRALECTAGQSASSFDTPHREPGWRAGIACPQEAA
jgi:hypothetical protein